MLLYTRPQTGDVILDVGCGVGLITLDLAKKGAYVIGIDICPAMLYAGKALSRERGIDNLEFIVASATNLPVRNTSVSKVATATFAEHIKEEEFDMFLQDSHRTIKSSGRLVIYTCPGRVAKYWLLLRDLLASCIKGRFPARFIEDLGSLRREGMTGIGHANLHTVRSLRISLLRLDNFDIVTWGEIPVLARLLKFFGIVNFKDQRLHPILDYLAYSIFGIAFKRK